MPFRIIEQLPYKKPIFKINYDNSLLTLSDNSLGLNGFVIKSSTPILKASIIEPYTPSFRSVTHGFDHFLPHPLPHVFANTIRVITSDSGT